MCKPLKEYLGVVREYKDTIVMFLGIAACVFVYADFRTVVKEQAETAAKTAEILRTMDARLSNLEHKAQ
ncbi:hypothetical protein [Akkermansia muciniphila]|jgi:hypothetical protein|uniref:hypothetical protein n=1 Tax=Akkermansia muciniphila TaxID=239935 RepID=UPI000B8E9C59|nr:hypothetical protein [Akkermansia muciniphila]